MRHKYSLLFHEVQQPITQPITKFGGQPSWLTVPQWPLSRSTGAPMRFICQIALDPEVFGEILGRMAYLFITDDEETFVDNTYDPVGGENAIVIQPGTCEIPMQPLVAGPTLYKMVSHPPEQILVPLDCEFAVELSAGDDPDVIIEDEQADENSHTWIQFVESLGEIKIGGTPAFLQDPEYPAGDNWRLLLQLDAANVPFYINFGDAGVGYAFLSEDGTSGKFLWQCS